MSEIKLDNTNGFHIYGWMVNELHLEGGDLLAFAIVHTFAQGHAGHYKGNTTYLSAWTGWTEKTSRSHLAHLVELGLIREFRGRENNSPFCYYELTEDFYLKHPVKTTGSPGKNFQNHPVNSSDADGKNYRENIIKNKKERIEFIPPTPQEVGEYAASLSFASPEGFGYFYVGHYANTNWIKKNGQPVKNWKNNIREVWLKNNKDKDFSDYIPKPTTAPESKTTNFAGL